MKKYFLSILLAVFVFTAFQHLKAEVKPRIIVLTDIENEPDDAMSMVRFLTYASQWDVEALIATTSIHQQNATAAWRIREIVEAYGKVRDNLIKHEKGYPASEYLLSVIKEGRLDYGMSAVGEGMDSPGSEVIIKVVDREDPRPVAHANPAGDPGASHPLLGSEGAALDIGASRRRGLHRLYPARRGAAGPDVSHPDAGRGVVGGGQAVGHSGAERSKRHGCAGFVDCL